MGFFSIFSSIAKGIVQPVVGYFDTKQKLREQTATNKLNYLKALGDRQASLVSQGLAADATWEMESIRAGQSYRGIELIIISIPTVMCFTPYAYIVRNGFDALAKTPTWFQFVFVTIFLANYGIRTWRRNTNPGKSGGSL